MFIQYYMRIIPQNLTCHWIEQNSVWIHSFIHNTETWDDLSFSALFTILKTKKSFCTLTHTFPLCVRREDSVAKPFPHMLQWKGLFFNLSICDSWLRKCCCRFDNWMKARPQSITWHLYGRSPILIHMNKLCLIYFLFTSCSNCKM